MLVQLLTLTWCFLFASASAAKLCWNSTGKLSSSLTENQTLAWSAGTSHTLQFSTVLLYAEENPLARRKRCIFQKLTAPLFCENHLFDSLLVAPQNQNSRASSCSYFFLYYSVQSSCISSQFTRGTTTDGTCS